MTSVSIVMPCYNVRQFVDRAIDSVRAQTIEDWEIVAVDDCSSDGTFEYLEQLAASEPRIRVLATRTNSGPSAARNLAIDHCRGEWIAILDADDAYRKDRLETLTRGAIDVHAQVMFDNLVYYDAGAEVETGIALPTLDAHIRKPITLAALIEGERPASDLKLGFLKPLINRDFLDGHHLRYDPGIRLAEDFDLYARMLLAGGAVWLCGAPLYVYTTQVGHVSRERSSATRTKYEPEIRVRIFDRLIEDHRGKVAGEDLELLERGRKWQELYSDAFKLGQHRREGRWPAFAALAVTHPRAFLRFAVRSKYLRRIFFRGQRNAAGV